MFGVLVMTVAFTWANLATVGAQSDNRVLRTRGIIVEDEAGRERVLIGAPIPAAANRARTNDRRVRELWASRYPNQDQYMALYKGYQHSTNGILILDESGVDRVAIGDPVPDATRGKRIGPGTGMVINDDRGLERSGYGLLKVDGKNRMVLGLDREGGAEGLTLSLYDDGSTGLSVRDQQRVVFVGSAPASQGLTGSATPFHGLLVRGPEGVRFVQNAAEK